MGKRVLETGINSVSETGIKKISETGIKSVLETGIKRVSETEIKRVSETGINLKRVSETGKFWYIKRGEYLPFGYTFYRHLWGENFSKKTGIILSRFGG